MAEQDAESFPNSTPRMVYSPPRQPHGQAPLQPAVSTRAAPTPPAIVLFEAVYGELVWQKYHTSASTLLDKKEISSVLTYTLVHFGEPFPSMRVLSDVREKQHVNNGTETDTVDLETGKNRHRIQGSGFMFTMHEGIYINPNDCSMIGPSIFGSGAGASCEEHERASEKIVVPPGSKVNVKVKTWIMKYEGEAVIDVGAPADYPVNFMYTETCLCGLCRSTRRGTITMQEVFQTQPSYRKVGNMVYYQGRFKYTYNGEQFDLHKVEEKIA